MASVKREFSRCAAGAQFSLAGVFAIPWHNGGKSGDASTALMRISGRDAFGSARRVIIALGLLNFVIFVAIACYLGGDAVNGKVEGGHYYLFGVRTESGHKVYTEVSEAVFIYSRLHVYSLFLTSPVLMVAMYIQNRTRKLSNQKHNSG